MLSLQNRLKCLKFDVIITLNDVRIEQTFESCDVIAENASEPCRNFAENFARVLGHLVAVPEVKTRIVPDFG